jgi:hypothetical protein
VFDAGQQRQMQQHHLPSGLFGCHSARIMLPNGCTLLLLLPFACCCCLSAAQVVSECIDERGVLVGFWCPPFVGSNLNVPGFHFHFLSADRQRGGHVLQLRMEQGSAWLQEVRPGCDSTQRCLVMCK